LNHKTKTKKQLAMTKQQETTISVSRHHIEDFLQYIWANTTSPRLVKMYFSPKELRLCIADRDIEFLCGRCLGLEITNQSLFKYHLSCTETYEQGLRPQQLQKLYREFRNFKRSKVHSV